MRTIRIIQAFTVVFFYVAWLKPRAIAHSVNVYYVYMLFYNKIDEFNTIFFFSKLIF